MRILTIMAVLMVAAVSVIGASKDDGQIAVVSMSRVIQNYPGTVSSEAILKKQVEEFEAEKEKLVAKLEEMQKALESAHKETENSALSEDAKAGKKKIVEEKFVDMKKYQQSIRETMQLRQEQIADEKNRLQKRIFEKLKETVTKYAEGKGYKMVIDTTALIYNQDKMDITDDIIKIVQKEEKGAGK